MAKRFIEPNWKELRKLPSELQRAWFYIWDKADEAGVYVFDAEYMNLDLGLNNQISLQDLGRLPECEILPGERVFIKNLIAVNYTKLKHDYNPHKPAFRAIEKNGLVLNSRLNQACFKLEEEGEDKEEEEGEIKGGAGGKEIVPQMQAIFKKHNPGYGFNRERDFPPLLSIAQYIAEQIGSGPPQTNVSPVLAEWEIVSKDLGKAVNFYHGKTLKSVSTHIQEIYQKAKNGNTGHHAGGNTNRGKLPSTATIRPDKAFEPTL